MDLDFAGKVVLVTGASGGIGAAVAEAFVASGARAVVAHYHRDRSRADQLVARGAASGVEVAAVSDDLADHAGPARVVAETVRRFGRIDVLVNNAGAMVERSSVEDAPDALFDAVLDLNYRAVFAACRAAVPVMCDGGGGSIVNVSSSAARNGGTGGSVLYAAAKAAVSTFSRGLAAEVARDNIRVNVVAPGLFATRFHDGVTSREQLDRIGLSIPVGRPGYPHECAGPVLFLAHDAASYVTGHSLEVNGGRLMP